MFGLFDLNNIIITAIIIKGNESLIENSGLNFTLSRFLLMFDGFDDPFSCSKIRCTNAKPAIAIGNIKCREKNRFNVGCDTEGPPQIHVTKSFPTIGIAVITPVITVAPHKDICPHGRTYPRNAVAIVINKITTPEIHTLGLLDGDEKYIPRAVWAYNKMKNNEAPFIWIIRVIHPLLISRMIITITLKAFSVSAVYIIDRMNPVRICSPRVIPSRNPMFHIKEIDEGEGKSSRDFFSIKRIGFLFDS